MNDTVAELLSAYLDDALDVRERADFEAQLAADAELRAELESMRHLVGGLRALPQVAPPATIELALTRRLELAIEGRGLGARLARSMTRVAEQPVIAVTFALVLSIAAMIAVLARSVDPTVAGRIPVQLDPPPPAAPEVAVAVRHTSHGIFHLVEGVWIAADVVGPADRAVGLDDPVAIELLRDPNFARLAQSGPVRLRVRGEVWELRGPGEDGAAGAPTVPAPTVPAP